MKCNIRRAKEERVTAVYQTMGKQVLAYLDASVGCVVSEHLGYKKKRLQEMFDVTHSYLGYMMEVCGDGDEGQQQRAKRTLFKVQNKLTEYASFDFSEATLAMPYVDVFGDSWRNSDDCDKHQTRKKFINDMELVVQTYHAQILHWFWLHKGFGKGRLMWVYRLIREDYNLWITEYLRCNRAGDMAAQEMLSQRQDKMQTVGMEFEEV